MYSWSVCNGTTFTSHRMSKLEISIFCLCFPKPSYYQYFKKLKPNPQPTTKRHRRTKKSGLGRHQKDYTITVDLQTNSLSNRSGQGGDPSTRLLSSGKGAAPPHLEDTAEGGWNSIGGTQAPFPLFLNPFHLEIHRSQDWNSKNFTCFLTSNCSYVSCKETYSRGRRELISRASWSTNPLTSIFLWKAPPSEPITSSHDTWVCFKTKTAVKLYQNQPLRRW